MSTPQAMFVRDGFEWRAYDAYLFDIDGTLLNTRDGVHYNAFHSGLRAVYGTEQRIDDVPVHGNTDVGILRAACQLAGIGEAEFRRGLPAAIRAMCEEVEHKQSDVHAELCPSIVRLLEELRDARKTLGIASGNLEPIAWTKLRACGLARFFSFGSFSDRNDTRVEIFRHGANMVRTAAPDASVCFVGDTPSDVLAAKALGLPVIAVATGIYSVSELTEHEPDICIASCEALLS